jgi:putative ABC transport system ATP-binding protein
VRAPLVPAMAEPALVARGVRKTFDPEVAPVPALRGAGLRLERGEFVALVGPSGCGKSTFLNVVAGLEPADGGTIAVAGHELLSMREDELARMRRKHVGMVFQFFELIETMTARENVALAALAGGASRRQADDRARDLLDLLGLLDKASAAPSTLSGGQRQRLAIARALANEPTLLLADEPTGALDSAGASDVLDLFARLNARGQTILVVTHDAAVAAAADRIVRMRDGRMENGA